MKTILAFGDSITWGANARSGTRHAFEDRWPNVLEAGLDGKARVLSDGLRGRTTMFDDWGSNSDRNGARLLSSSLYTHDPLDMIIFMLGTNDMKPTIHGNAQTASYGIRKLMDIVRGHYTRPGDVQPKILVIAPALLAETASAEHAEMFAGAIEESKRFAHFYKLRAAEYGAGFFDASKVAVADPIDGIHLDAANTRAIGQALVPVVKSMLGL